MAKPKLYIVTHTIIDRDKDGKAVPFLKSDKPQALGVYGPVAVKAGKATLYTPAESDDTPTADEGDGVDKGGE